MPHVVCVSAPFVSPQGTQTHLSVRLLNGSSCVATALSAPPLLPPPAPPDAQRTPDVVADTRCALWAGALTAQTPAAAEGGVSHNTSPGARQPGLTQRDVAAEQAEHPCVCAQRTVGRGSRPCGCLARKLRTSRVYEGGAAAGRPAQQGPATAVEHPACVRVGTPPAGEARRRRGCHRWFGQSNTRPASAGCRLASPNTHRRPGHAPDATLGAAHSLDPRRRGSACAHNTRMRMRVSERRCWVCGLRHHTRALAACHMARPERAGAAATS